MPNATFGRLPAFALFFVVVGARLLLIARYGTATPMHDEWDAVGYQLYRVLGLGQLGLSNLLSAFNEHRIFTTRLYELLMLKLNGGIWNPLQHMLGNTLLQGLGAVAVARLLLPASPEKSRPLLLVFMLLLFGLPLSVENILVGFQTQFYLLLLFSFIFLGALLRARPFSGAWLGGLLCGLLLPLTMASGALTLLCGAVFLAYRAWRLGGQRGDAVLAVGLAVLAMVAIAFTPTVHTYDEVRAHSPQEFAWAFSRVLAWPVGNSLAGLLPDAVLPYAWPIIPLCALFVQFPLIRFAWRQLRQPPAADDASWGVLLLGLWLLMQFLAIGYSRAAMPLASRYTDLFVLGLVLNLVCLLRQEQAQADVPEEQRPLMPYVQPWLLAVVAGGLIYGYYLIGQIDRKMAFAPIAEQNVRAYLHSHDGSILTQNEYPRIPYADPVFMKTLLDDPQVVAVLPPNLVPEHAGQESVALAGAVAFSGVEGVVLLVVGVGCLGVWVRRMGQASI